MRILVLSPRQCFPANSGAKLRELHLLRALGEAGEVCLAGFADRQAQAAKAADLPFCREVRFVAKPAAYRPSQIVRGIIGKWPISVLNYTGPEMLDAARALCRERSFDLVQLESIHMMRYAEDLQNEGLAKRAVYNWHNIESELMQRYATSGPSAARRLYANLTAGKLARLEREILEEAFGHVVCSEREREALLRIVPRARVAVVENGVDSSGFTPAAEEDVTGPRHRVVFVGAMDYFPNAEAAIWFAQEVWPSVRRELKDAEFVVVGARPPQSVLALREIPGVVVTGTVEDVRPYYRQALAAVVPLRTGGGTRLKILEAMAAGTPVVSTALGAEGLAVQPETEYLLAGTETAELWVKHLGSLASDPEQGARLRTAGLRLARERYDWRRLGARLVDTYRGWLGGA